MKVLHVSDVYLPRLGGIERQVADLAAQQRLRGHDVQVLTSTRAADQDSGSDIEVLRRPWAALQAARLIADVRPDVVHCHTSMVSPLAWAAARQGVALGLPTILTMHSVTQQARPLSAGLAAVADLIGEAAVWTAVSHVATQALAPAIGRDVHVLPNGVDPQMWRTSSVGEREVLTVVSVMRLAARKRPMALLDVLDQVARRLDGSVRWQAVLAGSGPQEAAVAREIRRRGLQDVVQLTGRLDRPSVVDLLGAADVYVAPAVLESFGIAALEARCSGVPVVGMREAGIAEFVQHGVHGELVGGDAQMADSISGLLGDRSRLRLLAEGARHPVPHAWDAVVERCEELYEVAACQTQGSRPTVVHP